MESDYGMDEDCAGDDSLDVEGDHDLPYEDDGYDDSMDGDHESALESVYGPEDGECYDYEGGFED